MPFAPKGCAYYADLLKVHTIDPHARHLEELARPSGRVQSLDARGRVDAFFVAVDGDDVNLQLGEGQWRAVGRTSTQVLLTRGVPLLPRAARARPPATSAIWPGGIFLPTPLADGKLIGVVYAALMLTRRQAIVSALAATGAGSLLPLLKARADLVRNLDQPLDPHDAYDLDPKITYFNHASTGTMPRVVREARDRSLKIIESNPWLYLWSDAWTEALDRARTVLAASMGCNAPDLAITRTTTEAMNILAQGLPLTSQDEVLYSSLNHIGASKCFEHWGARLGYATRRFDFPLNDAPGLSPSDVVRLHVDQIGDNTRVLVFPHIDNLVGLTHPVREIAQAAHDRGVEFVLVDGAQAVGMIPVDFASLGVDAYGTSAHKWLQSPKGYGLLALREGLVEQIQPMMVTWGQDRWTDARKLEDFGTRDPSGILALADAAAFQERLEPKRAWARRQSLMRALRQRVEASDRLIWRSPRDPALMSAIGAVEVRDESSTDVFARLYPEHGFVFRAFTGEMNTIRISLNLANTVAQLDRFFELV